MPVESIQEFIQPHLDSIEAIFKKDSGQFMIVGMDNFIIDEVVKKLSSLSAYKVVKVEKQKVVDADEKIFILKLENNSSMEYQSLIYYYLELPANNSCFVCLVSTSTLALEFFEKRVRSRFKNRIFFIPYILNTENEEKRFEIHSSIEEKEQQNLMEKYNIPKYSLDTIFDLFEPIHFALLSIAFNQKLNIKKCYEQFKKAIIDTPELKGTPSTKVLYSVLDLIECNAVNSSGMPLVDFNEFKAFISRNCPLYLKKLISSQNKFQK